MPTIPRAQRTRTITAEAPAALIPVGQAGAVAESVGRVADAAGNLIAERAQVLRDQDRANQSILIKSQYDDEMRAFKRGEMSRKGSDAYGNVDRGRDFRAEMIEKYAGKIEDPVLKKSVSAYIQGRSGSMLDSLSIHQDRQRQAVTAQARDLTMSGLMKDAFGGESLEETLGVWRQTIVDQNSLGLISDEEAVAEIQAGESSLAEAHLDGLIETDPESGIKAIEAGGYDQFLTQKQQEDFKKKGRQLKKAIKKDLETRKREQERLDKIAKKEAQAQTGNEFLGRLLDGTLTRAEVMASNLEPTGQNGKRTWIKAIEDREKKVEKNDDEWKTVPSVMADFQTRITLDPRSVTDSDIMEAQGQGLSTTDARTLINYKNKKIGKAEDPQKTQEAKTAYTRLRDAKTARIYSQNRKENSDIWAQNVGLLQDWIDSHPGEDPAAFVDELLTPAENSFINNILSFTGLSEPAETEEQRAERLRAEASSEAVTTEGEAAIEQTQVEPEEAPKVKVKVVRNPDGTTEAIFPNGTRRTVTIEDGKVKF